MTGIKRRIEALEAQTVDPGANPLIVVFDDEPAPLDPSGPVLRVRFFPSSDGRPDVRLPGTAP